MKSNILSSSLSPCTFALLAVLLATAIIGNVNAAPKWPFDLIFKSGEKAAVKAVERAAAQEVGHVLGQEIGHVVAQGVAHAAGHEVAHSVVQGAAHAAAQEIGHVLAQEAAHTVGQELAHSVVQGAAHAAAQELGHVVAQEAAHAVGQEVVHSGVQGAAHAAGQQVAHVAAEGAAHAASQQVAHVAAQDGAHAIAHAGESAAAHAIGHAAAEAAVPKPSTISRMVKYGAKFLEVASAAGALYAKYGGKSETEKDRESLVQEGGDSDDAGNDDDAPEPKETARSRAGTTSPSKSRRPSRSSPGAADRERQPSKPRYVGPDQNGEVPCLVLGADHVWEKMLVPEDDLILYGYGLNGQELLRHVNSGQDILRIPIEGVARALLGSDDYVWMIKGTRTILGRAPGKPSTKSPLPAKSREDEALPEVQLALRQDGTPSPDAASNS